MANYGMGGADGRGADDMQELVRNQKQNLEHDRRVLGIDAEQGRKPQVSGQLPRRCPFGRAFAWRFRAEQETDRRARQRARRTRARYGFRARRAGIPREWRIT